MSIFCRFYNYAFIFIPAEKITDISLQDLDNNDIIEIGITQKGPQKLILKAINILNSKNESSGIEPPQDDQTDQHQTTVLFPIKPLHYQVYNLTE